jgi:hypothetical protein
MPMLLKGDNGNEFELALVEDRLPDPQDSYGDGVFVALSFRVATADESWEESVPCLNLYEVSNLLDWLDGLGGSEGEDAEIELLEPQLRFSVVKAHAQSVTIRVSFHLEDAPEELVAMDPETDEAAHVDVRLSREQIRAAALELRRDLDEIQQTPKDNTQGDADPGGIAAPEADLGLASIAGRDAGATDEGLGDPERDAGRVRQSEDAPPQPGKVLWGTQAADTDPDQRRRAAKIKLPDEVERTADRVTRDAEAERRAHHGRK